MYTHYDLKIVESLVKSELRAQVTANKYTNESIIKPSPYSNVINVGNMCKVFYNYSLQDFIFIETYTDKENKFLRCFWYRRKDNSSIFIIDVERSSWLYSLLYTNSDISNESNFRDINIKISNDGNVVLIKIIEPIKSYSEEQFSKCNMSLYDLEDFPNMITKLEHSNNENSFIMGDSWLYHKVDGRRLIFISDPLYNSNMKDRGMDNFNRGRVFFGMLDGVNNKFIILEPDEKIQKMNLMFGHNLSLTKNDKSISIGVNDITLISISYEINDLIERYEKIE